MQAAYGLGVGDSLVFGRNGAGELIACGKLRPGGPLPAAEAAPEKIVVTLDRSRRRRRTQTPYDPSDATGTTLAANQKSLKDAEQEEVHILYFRNGPYALSGGFGGRC